MASASSNYSGGVGATQIDLYWSVERAVAACAIPESCKQVAAPTKQCTARLDCTYVRTAGAGREDSSCHAGDRSGHKFVYERAVTKLAICIAAPAGQSARSRNCTGEVVAANHLGHTAGEAGHLHCKGSESQGAVQHMHVCRAATKAVGEVSAIVNKPALEQTHTLFRSSNTQFHCHRSVTMLDES